MTGGCAEVSEGKAGEERMCRVGRQAEQKRKGMGGRGTGAGLACAGGAPPPVGEAFHNRGGVSGCK